jgi:hypothetical protein
MPSSIRSPRLALLLLALLAASGARAQSGAPAPNDTAAARRIAAGVAGSVGAGRVFLDTISPAGAQRGSVVTLWGRFPPNADRFTLWFEPAFQARCAPEAAGCRGVPGAFHVPLASTLHDSVSARFTIPPDARFGYYRVSVGGADSAGPRVYAATPGSGYQVRNGDSVSVLGVEPAVAYTDAVVEAVVDVQGLSPIADENELLLNGRVYAPCDSVAAGCVQRTVDPNGHTLRLRWLARAPNPLKGLVKVQVRVGERISKERTFIISRVKERTPAWLALALLGLIVAGTLALLWPLTRTADGVGSRRAALSTIAFLDRETNTYSLSKLQFYLWTAAALVGYAYLTICRSMVRGDFTFADVPGGLPSLLAITTGTSALAVGITSAKGSKGAGEHHPSASDLLTSGGLVAPERLQFLVWTMVGVAAFIVLALSTSPAEIEHLPSIPEGFLGLMGISSVGYLGGKLARKPGPVIKRVEATLGSLILHVDGTSLAPDALFRVDGQDVMPSMLDAAEHPSGRPTIIADGDQPGFARTLLLKLGTPPEAWTRLPNPAGKTPDEVAGTHSLTIINPDGQRAVWNFTITPPPARDPEQVTGGRLAGGGTPAPQPGAGGAAGATGTPVTPAPPPASGTSGAPSSGTSPVTIQAPAGASDESGDGEPVEIAPAPAPSTTPATPGPSAAPDAAPFSFRAEGTTPATGTRQGTTPPIDPLDAVG